MSKSSVWKMARLVWTARKAINLQPSVFSCPVLGSWCHDGRWFLFFWLTGVELNVIFCCVSSSISRFHVSCIIRCFFAHHTCWVLFQVTRTFLLSQSRLVILLWSLFNKVFQPADPPLTGCSFQLCVHVFVLLPHDCLTGVPNEVNGDCISIWFF